MQPSSRMRVLSVAIVAILILAFGGALSRTPSATAATSHAAGIVIPLYTYPTDRSWASVIKAKQAYPNVPFTVVINPNNGPDTSSDPNYATGIKNFQAAGIQVLGYVYTSYGARSTSSIVSDVNAYDSWYHVNGESIAFAV